MRRKTARRCARDGVGRHDSNGFALCLCPFGDGTHRHAVEIDADCAVVGAFTASHSRCRGGRVGYAIVSRTRLDCAVNGAFNGEAFALRVACCRQRGVACAVRNHDDNILGRRKGDHRNEEEETEQALHKNLLEANGIIQCKGFAVRPW